VDENHIIKSGTIEQNISPSNTDFYIKILVEKCSSSQSHDCFALSNGTYYRLDFEQAVTTSGTLVNGDFLKNSGAPIGTNGNGVNGNVTIVNGVNANGTNGNVTIVNGVNANGTNQSPSINEFNDLIVKALTRTFGIEGFKELIVKALSQDFSIVKKSSLKEFNDLIVNALQTVTPTSKTSSVDTNSSSVDTNSSSVDTNSSSVSQKILSPVATSSKKQEHNPQIDDKKTYFIKPSH
jgi:ribosomal protein S7